MGVGWSLGMRTLEMRRRRQGRVRGRGDREEQLCSLPAAAPHARRIADTPCGLRRPRRRHRYSGEEGRVARG